MSAIMGERTKRARKRMNRYLRKHGLGENKYDNKVGENKYENKVEKVDVNDYKLACSPWCCSNFSQPTLREWKCSECGLGCCKTCTSQHRCARIDNYTVHACTTFNKLLILSGQIYNNSYGSNFEDGEWIHTSRLQWIDSLHARTQGTVYKLMSPSSEYLTHRKNMGLPLLMQERQYVW